MLQIHGCRSTSCRGWTVVELLVVVGVLLILVGLALPMIAGARGVARRTVCQQQMSSHQTVIAAYANDYKDLWPFALPRGFGTSVQPDMAAPTELGWYDATPAFWFMALQDEYGAGVFAEPLMCPADTESIEERDRLARARGVSVDRVRALPKRVLSLALYLDPLALDPVRPSWDSRYFRVTRRGEVLFPDRKAALFEVVPFHDETYVPRAPLPRPQRHLVVGSVDGSVRYRWSEDWVPGIVFDSAGPAPREGLEAEMNKLIRTPEGVRGRDW